MLVLVFQYSLQERVEGEMCKLATRIKSKEQIIKSKAASSTGSKIYTTREVRGQIKLAPCIIFDGAKLIKGYIVLF